MNFQSAIKKFFQEVEKMQYESILKLFSPHAIIHSPLYGSREATHFYKELLADTKSAKFQIKTVFNSADHPNTAAALIVTTWTLKNGKSTTTDCVDIFEFAPNTDKIQSVTIIYDTQKVRPEFQRIHPEA